MLRILIDHDFNQKILRGLMRRIPGLDVVIAYDEGLSELPDPELLAWAAAEDRVIFSHDRRIMPDHPANLMAAGERLTGIIIVPQQLPIGQAIDDLEEIVMYTEQND